MHLDQGDGANPVDRPAEGRGYAAGAAPGSGCDVLRRASSLDVGAQADAGIAVPAKGLQWIDS